MNWIQKNPHQFCLGLASGALLAASAMVVLKTMEFSEGFSGAKTTPPRSSELKPADTEKFESAIKQLAAPSLWASPGVDGGSLFVSRPMMKSAAGGLIPVETETTHAPVPNQWLIKHNLDVLSAKVLEEDPDGDGFTNLDEYLGADLSAANGEADSTNPNDKASHPSYFTKLFLKEYKEVKFRLIFNAYDGDPKRDKPEAMTFQINTLDLQQPSVFLKIGEMVPNTRFKLVKFEYKTVLNENIQENEEVSELTLQNTETNDPIVLVYTKVTNSPDSYAIFSYLWPEAKQAQEIKVKKLQEFVLKPNIEERYKLIDINKTETLIQLPSGDKYKVPALPKK